MVEKLGIVWNADFVVLPAGTCPGTLSKSTLRSQYNVRSALPLTHVEINLRLI